MTVTMADVARRAKVSQATVSKALRGLPSIPPRTRERIAALARQLGYRPHPYLSALMQHRRRRGGALPPRTTLAFLTSHPHPDSWRTSPSPFFRLLYAGAAEMAEERGYALSPFWLFQDGMSGERFSQMLVARGVRGILLNPLPKPGMPLDLDWSQFSVVAHGLSLAEPVFHRTSNDHFQSMVLAMRECRRLGYRRPGFLLDAPSSARLEFRWEGAFRIALEKYGFPGQAEPLLSAEWDAAEIRRWVRRERPDVVISLFIESQLAELRTAGLRIPEALGAVSLSVHDPASQVTGINQNPRLMGAVAAERLISLVERGETGIPANPVTLTIEGAWNPGRTVRARPGRLTPSA